MLYCTAAFRNSLTNGITACKMKKVFKSGGGYGAERMPDTLQGCRAWL